MAKFLKIKLVRTQANGMTHYTFPPEYERSKIQVLAYETSQKQSMLDEVVARGNDYEHILGVVKDIDAPAFLASIDIEELSQVEAETLGETWIDSVINVSNIPMLILAASKVGEGLVLLPQESNALNPDNAEPGLSRGETFTENLIATAIAIDLVV